MKQLDCLERPVKCLDCETVSRAGQLIAADVLRCPKCRSDQIAYLTPKAPSALQ